MLQRCMFEKQRVWGYDILPCRSWLLGSGFQKQDKKHREQKHVGNQGLLEDEKQEPIMFPLHLSKYINKPTLFIWLQPQPMLAREEAKINHFRRVKTNEKSMW